MKVFTAHNSTGNRAIGYYALQLGNESMNEVENKSDDYTKNRSAFPAVHLAYLAVTKSSQRAGIGTALMADVFDRVYDISRSAGFYALTLQSVDAKSTSFYSKLGFQRYAGSETSPKMLIPLRTIIDLVESNRSQ